MTAMATPAAGAAKAAFPPFESATYASQLFWLVLVFGFLYWLMAKVVVPRMGGILADRATRISSDLDGAATARARAEEAGQAYEKALAEARAKAQGLAQETRDKASAEQSVRSRALEAELSARVAKAEADISAMKTRAMGNVAGIATDAASAIVERLIGTAPAKAAVAEAVKSVTKG
jgi:F-type H+-transporting ATPase subunit b